MEPTLRMATNLDIETLVCIRLDFLAEVHKEKWKAAPELHAVIEESFRAYCVKHLEKELFVALIEKEGKILSLAFLSIQDKPANLKSPTGKLGLITNVYTHSEYRKQGHAVRALKHLIEEAQRQNVSSIKLAATKAGEPVYRKLGFQENDPAGLVEMELSFVDSFAE
ncbi:MAG: GNAT family N-acetyltransferase [Coriobacteriia bacterium]|jgi:GNAT superfamily N-acetyltransferase|nr:GNAT family N-acetyltransferase [Coriobacteriia bacterium]MDR2714084.1 GNAT family N-acetyltransferase [Coriobacteriales bacterium]